ncbi:hypothetical protein ACLB2K_005966 [Fragaria x ananassa]
MGAAEDAGLLGMLRSKPSSLAGSLATLLVMFLRRSKAAQVVHFFSFSRLEASVSLASLITGWTTTTTTQRLWALQIWKLARVIGLRSSLRSRWV